MTIDPDEFNKLAEAVLSRAYDLREDSTYLEIEAAWRAGRDFASAARRAMRLRKAADVVAKVRESSAGTNMEEWPSHSDFFKGE